jgi:hypothetical protein
MSGVVEALAAQVFARLTRKIIADLQRMRTALLSGDDSGLTSTWDEICIEIQYQQSIYWDAYDDTARAVAHGHIAGLARHEREALWLQTDEGRDWVYEETYRREESIRRQVCEEFGLTVYRADPGEGYSAVNGDQGDDYPILYDDIMEYVMERVYGQAADWTNRRIRAYIDRRYEYD